MMNDYKIMISDEKFKSLSQEAKYLYTTIYDYLTYVSDPQYHKLHAFRTAISKLEGRDREVLVEYFNSDPAIQWTGMPCEPWLYYKEPY